MCGYPFFNNSVQMMGLSFVRSLKEPKLVLPKEMDPCGGVAAFNFM